MAHIYVLTVGWLLPFPLTYYFVVLCFQNPVEAVEKVAKFLNKDLPRSVIEEIAEKCSFDKLKKADETKDKSVFPALSNVNLPKVTNNTMYRKGKNS